MPGRQDDQQHQQIQSLPAPLRMFESKLRCPICQDFYSTAMIIKECSHNFCSLCIRRHLLGEAECPICRGKITLHDISNNRLVDELVKEYKERIASLLKERVSDCEECPICQEFFPLKELEQHTNKCLDSSASSTKMKKFKSFFEKEYPTKMVKPVYNLIKDQDLRRMLGDQKLSTKGDRRSLIWRHQEYLLLCNSEYDSSAPKDLQTIRKMVAENEKTVLADEELIVNTANTAAISSIHTSPERYIKENQFHFKHLVEDIKRRKQLNKQ